MLVRHGALSKPLVSVNGPWPSQLSSWLADAAESRSLPPPTVPADAMAGRNAAATAAADWIAQQAGAPIALTGLDDPRKLSGIGPVF